MLCGSHHLFVRTVVWSSVVAAHPNLLLRLTGNGCLGCFQFGAVMKSATLNILIKTFVSLFKKKMCLSYHPSPL